MRERCLRQEIPGFRCAPTPGYEAAGDNLGSRGKETLDGRWLRHALCPDLGHSVGRIPSVGGGWNDRRRRDDPALSRGVPGAAAVRLASAAVSGRPSWMV